VSKHLRRKTLFGICGNHLEPGILRHCVGVLVASIVCIIPCVFP
jgi:hypothetical protein